MLDNRIKPLLDNIISPYQANFVPGRKGTDNVIILQELVYLFGKRKGRQGDMIVNIDLEKSYDLLEWSFIRETLIFFQFPTPVVNLILSCICNTNISILINGESSEVFSSSRGIRQGDLLSPYIFILCLEFISLVMSKALDNGC
ncbi:hypothetical protein SLE2022_158290 [Rubroshorea leprosula]